MIINELVPHKAQRKTRKARTRNTNRIKNNWSTIKTINSIVYKEIIGKILR